MPNFSNMPLVKAMEAINSWDSLKAFEHHVSQMRIAPTQRNHVLREATRHYIRNCPNV